MLYTEDKAGLLHDDGQKFRMSGGKLPRRLVGSRAVGPVRG
jgi:hypothetical protein